MIKFNSDILNKSIFKLPISREKIHDNKKKALPNFIFNKLNKYISIIEKLENFYLKKNDKDVNNYFDEDNNIFLLKVVKSLKDGIHQATKCYLHGSPYGAYDKLLKALEIDNKNNIFKIIKSVAIPNSIENYFFRVRINENSKKIMKKKDMFHVPFEMIEKVGTYRYSITGYPCLYLGNSIFTCLKEIDIDFFKYKKNQIYVSKFIYKADISSMLLDLRIKKREDINNNNYLFTYLCLFPLIFASSIKVLKPDEPFKPEYIIPQLLLQIIKKETNTFGFIDGILYSSTKIFDNNNSFNIVFYPRGIYPEGHCSYLVQLFDITEPLNVNEVLKEIDSTLLNNSCKKIEELIEKN